MEKASSRPQEVRFAAFAVDLQAGELRKHGVKISLQEQPFQTLSRLLERPGEVVTREELQKRLWSGNTFVDFEHSLATAVKKLRRAVVGYFKGNRLFVAVLTLWDRYLSWARLVWV